MSHVNPPHIGSPARTEPSIKQEVVAKEDDERYSKVVLLRNIARDLVPELLECGEELHLRGEDLRGVNRAFLAWPVRYKPPTCILFYPQDDDNGGLPATIDFSWGTPCCAFDSDESRVFAVFGDVDESELFARDDKDQMLLERVDSREA